MPGALDQLIPHRAPMQWITGLTDCTETTATATTCFEADAFAVAGGRIIETALVECLAQTVAAALGRRAQSGEAKSGGAANGMLVGVSNFKIQSRPPVGQILRIEIREQKRLGPMLLIAGTISCDGLLVASGELSLYACTGCGHCRLWCDFCRGLRA
jgi:predicted hotdog family 3-hydroxylacyl-ACP dehydratase